MFLLTRVIEKVANRLHYHCTASEGRFDFLAADINSLKMAIEIHDAQIKQLTKDVARCLAVANNQRLQS